MSSTVGIHPSESMDRQAGHHVKRLRPVQRGIKNHFSSFNIILCYRAAGDEQVGTPNTNLTLRYGAEILRAKI